MSENEKTILNEESLQGVAGGKGPPNADSHCGFVHKSGRTEITKRADGTHISECGGSCTQCGCWGRGYCVDRWHQVTENGSPIPSNWHPKWYK